MKFSERHGYVEPSDVIIRERITPEIQNAICSCFDELHNNLYSEKGYLNLEWHLWCKFLNKRKGDFGSYSLYKMVALFHGANWLQIDASSNYSNYSSL